MQNIEDYKLKAKAKNIAIHIAQQISSTSIEKQPFEHCIIKDFLPVNFYNAINENFPDPDNCFFTPMRNGTRKRDFFTYKDEQTEYEKIFNYVFISFKDIIAAAFLKILDINLPLIETNWHCSYIRNYPQLPPINCIDPHLDNHGEIFSAIIYFPSKNQNMPGTDLLEQTKDGSFNVIKKISALPNTCTFFKGSKKAWHQARPTDQERKVITIWLKHPSIEFL
jgi:hypothetical protein